MSETEQPEAVDLADYPRRYCPACNSVVKREFRKGPGGRPDAACPRCGSLERHRFLAVLLGLLRPALGDIDVLLEVAPSRQTTPLLAELGARHHLRTDLGFDSRLVDALTDLTRLPHRDGSIDLLVCYHVLEHISDDRAAMGEIARVLSPGGAALLQVPWRPGTRTDEDPDASPDERLARFGQEDHVRYYGDDFETRLMEAGLSLRRVTPGELLGEPVSAWMKLRADEPVWIARRAGAEATRDVGIDIARLPAVWEGLLDELLRRRAKENVLRGRVQKLRAEKKRLETGRPGHPDPSGPVRRLKRAMRRS
ncbi:MAG TPA: class I SAM-dependent methyltransferase [Nocardioides sp.]|nr:class I SAM-dependent methyltransferase [Nocardioides sp.]